MLNNIKVVIPSRYGSSRLPGKPLLKIGNKSMIICVCERVSEALPNVDMIVATDDLRIYEEVNKYGFDVVMTSDKHLSGTDRIAEVARINNWNDDIRIINIQGDEPIIPVEIICSFYQLVLNDTHLEMATVCGRFSNISDINDTNKVKVVLSENGTVHYFSRVAIPFINKSENIDVNEYKKHTGIYAYTTNVLKKLSRLNPSKNEMFESLEQLRALDNGIKISILDVESIIPTGVDSLTDLQHVRRIYNDEK